MEINLTSKIETISIDKLKTIENKNNWKFFRQNAQQNWKKINKILQ